MRLSWSGEGRCAPGVKLGLDSHRFTGGVPSPGGPSPASRDPAECSDSVHRCLAGPATRTKLQDKDSSPPFPCPLPGLPGGGRAGGGRVRLLCCVSLFVGGVFMAPCVCFSVTTGLNFLWFPCGRASVFLSVQ